MMKYRKRIILSILLVVLVFAGVWTYRYFFTLYISSANPSFSSISYQTPFIKLYFNKNLDPESLKVSDPNSLFYADKTTISDSHIDLVTDTNKLHIDREVSFAIEVKSKDGSYSFNETIRFTPKDIAYEKLPKDQQKAIMSIQDSKPDYYKDPILDKLPYSTLEYEIKPNFNPDSGPARLTLDITVFLSNIDIKEGRTAAINRYHSHALKYIESINSENKKYTTNLIVREP
ncbi:MAG TPA: hypothetical protein VGE13_01105 [Candidatus Saccharimonadales bacterium]